MAACCVVAIMVQLSKPWREPSSMRSATTDSARSRSPRSASIHERSHMPYAVLHGPLREIEDGRELVAPFQLGVRAGACRRP